MRSTYRADLCDSSTRTDGSCRACGKPRQWHPPPGLPAVEGDRCADRPRNKGASSRRHLAIAHPKGRPPPGHRRPTEADAPNPSCRLRVGVADVPNETTETIALPAVSTPSRSRTMSAAWLISMGRAHRWRARGREDELRHRGAPAPYPVYFGANGAVRAGGSTSGTTVCAAA
jgi:hypothetical protein